MNFFTANSRSLFRELEAPVACVTPNQIDCNSHQPGVQAAIAAKSGAVLVSISEAILSQRLREIHVMYRRKDEPKHARPIPLDEPVEVIDLDSPVLHAYRNESGRRRLLHRLV